MKVIKIIIKIILILLAILALLLVTLIGGCFISSYFSSKEFEKYGGHGFEYMNGFSSTDFTGYHVYDSDKLVSLDHKANLWIENEDEMPILDGAEACYPIYTAVAKAIYKDIDKIELDVIERYENYLKQRRENDEKEIFDVDEELMDQHFSNGKIVTFTNSLRGYERLVTHKIDLMMGARPSSYQKEFADSFGEQIITIPIGKEAFVFFIEKDNPVDNLTSDQIRAIYHGDITNWKEVGGKNQKIIAFQRPASSGSQVMMNYFMGDVSLKEPDTMEMQSAMGGVIKQVKQYHNEAGALGYTFNYFLTGLQQEKDVKILSVDGVYPSVETIKDGSYPIIADLVIAKIASNTNPNTDKVIDFLLSKDGQEIIEKTGYGALDNPERKERIENDNISFDRYINQENNATFDVTDETFRLIIGDSLYNGYLSFEQDTIHCFPENTYSGLSFEIKIEGNTLTINNVIIETIDPKEKYPKDGDVYILSK